MLASSSATRLLRTTWLCVLAAAAPAADLHDACQPWAEQGECEANPSFMQANCAKSCAGARAYKSQIRRECAGYAQQGECSRNPAFMLSTCRTECDQWERQHGLKIDRDSRCVEWSLLGECRRDPQRMAHTCNTSCTVQQRCDRSTYTGWSVGICDKALRCEAKDKRTDCASRAKAGECRSRATRMAQDCLSTCAELDVDAVLSAQRPEMRARLSRYYDLPTRVSRAQERCWVPGWPGHNQYKLHLPTQCAAPRSLPWQRYGRRAATRERLHDQPGLNQLTCPLDVRHQTPRVRWGGPRNVSLPPHTPHVVRVVQVLASPRVRLLRDFLTDEEADAILKLAEPLFMRSPVRSVATDRRTSSTATLHGGLGGINWAVKRVRERIAAFSGYARAQCVCMCVYVCISGPAP